MTRAIPFTKAQVRRAVQAAESAGLTVRGVRMYPDGSIQVETGDDRDTPYGQPAKARAASWDDA